MAAVHELAPVLGTAAACAAVGLWRGAPARQRAQASAHARHGAFVGPHRQRAPRPRPPLALDAAEHQRMLDILNSERFADTAPAAVHATLLDEGFFGRLKIEMFYSRDWLHTTIDEFVACLGAYIRWYNEARIKVSLGARSPIDHRRSLGIAV